VYVELLARHIDEGVIQMATDEEHAFAAGYDGDRGVRSWRERMRLLEQVGVIRIQRMGAKRFAYVLLVHPSVFITALQAAGKVDAEWLVNYRHRRLETGEIAVATVTRTGADRDIPF
jgi:hypothetical protein